MHFWYMFVMYVGMHRKPKIFFAICTLGCIVSPGYFFAVTIDALLYHATAICVCIGAMVLFLLMGFFLFHKYLLLFFVVVVKISSHFHGCCCLKGLFPFS